MQLNTVQVTEGFTVVAGVATADATRVVVETVDGEEIRIDELVETRSGDLLAWASPRLLGDVESIVAYVGDDEVARISPDDASSPPFDANTQPDTAEGSGRGSRFTVEGEVVAGAATEGLDTAEVPGQE